MTRRGRVTLAAAGLAVGLSVASGIGSWGAVDPEGPWLPPVSAAAPPPRSAPDAPRGIFDRLPVGSRMLDLMAVDAGGVETGPLGDPESSGRPVETVSVRGGSPRVQGPLRVVYTFDAALTRWVVRVLERGRVKLGHAIVMDPASGRVLAYASTDPIRFSPERAYPAASLVKVITAAAALDADPDVADLPCRYTGNPYRLTRKRIDPPRRGREVSLRHALATSNNQCFAQLAVHAVGRDELLQAISRFGWLSEPAPAHASGVAEPGEDRYDVGKLGCGLAGCRITPLHAVQLAASLAHGELVSPHWVERVEDVHGRPLVLPALTAPRRVMAPERADELRSMLVDTTTRGTARSAFRKRNGRPLLGPVEVAGKTGSLSGKDPDGRYEWFIGVAPADEPRVAVAVLLVQGHLWWRNASQIGADVLQRIFCEKGRCDPVLANRWFPRLEATAAPASAF